MITYIPTIVLNDRSVGGIPTPMEKYEFVKWDDEIHNWIENYQRVFPINTPILVGEFPMNHHHYSQLNGKIKHVPNHQPNHGLRIWDDPGTFGPDRSLFKDPRYKGGKVDEYIK